MRVDPALTAPRAAALSLMALSGFAGLGYQIVWTQQSALWLGHESAAVLAVVAAFFGGLAAGALLFGPRIERSVRPACWYAACEAMIGLWGAVLLVLMAPASAVALDLCGPQPTAWWQWTVAFSATFLLLLPATAAMGATLPAMERVIARWHTEGRSIAALYASNTLGAVVGVLATAFWLVPTFGFTRTAGLCIGLNLVCAAVALKALPGACPPALTHVPEPTAARAALVRLACTGLLGIGYEVLVVRVLSQVTEDTVYTFALLLAVYLVGTALGAAAYARWLGRVRDVERLGDRLTAALAAACLLGTSSLWASAALRANVQAAWGADMAAALGAEATLALAAFALPTVAMGALFSHLGARASAAGVGFGRALGANTLGAAFAPWLFGVVLAPAIGPKAALLSVALGYLLLMARAPWRNPSAWSAAAVAAALAVWAPPLAFVDLPEGGRVVSYLEGTMAAVSVVEDADGVSTLRINNRQQEGSSATRLVDARQALLPLLLHPAPHTALFLGLGTGVTATAAAEDPTLQVDAVELLPEVIQASPSFVQPSDGVAPASHLHVVAADARRFVRTAGRHYDVIVADNFHPARSGSGALYTVEHFRAVRERLAAGGLFCQWLPLHQLDLPTLRSIVRSFLAAYPQGSAILASNSLETPVIGLIGHAQDERLALGRVRTRIAEAAWPQRPAAFGIDDEYALLGSFVAGPAALTRFAGTATANTDDLPVVSYAAPRITYAPDSAPRDRLIALLNELAVAPGDVLADSTEPAALQRLAAYWAARDRFIVVGRDVRPSPDVRVMLAQVGAPLIAILQTSPDFRPAYEPLVRMAAALAGADPLGAQALQAELARVQARRNASSSAMP